MSLNFSISADREGFLSFLEEKEAEYRNQIAHASDSSDYVPKYLVGYADGVRFAVRALERWTELKQLAFADSDEEIERAKEDLRGAALDAPW